MPWALITFVSDLRGTYPLGGDNLLFPVRVSDLPSFRFGGGRMFYSVNEAFLSFSLHSVSLGVRYYGTGDSLFSDYSGYAAVRFGKVGFSALYGYSSVGRLRSQHGGGILSFEGWSTPLILRVSAGYVITPLLAAEVEVRREGAGLRAVAVSRPGIYVDLSLFSYVRMDKVSIGGMYRTSGNTFGIFLTYFYGGNAFSLLFSTHESLGESVFSDNLLVF